jgi:hypothetical protein
MSALSNYLENKLIDWFFRGQSFTPPADQYFGLVTVQEDDTDGVGTEVTGGSYARVEVESSLANWAGTQSAGSTTASSGTSGTTSNNGAITFPAPTADWGSIVGVAVYDAISSGNLLYWNPLVTPKTVNNGDPAPVFDPADFVFQWDN